MVDDAGADDALDRAAILARRQRFIALALSGLGAACGDGSGGPQPCLDVAPQTESGTAEAGTSTSAATGTTADTGSSSSGAPMPCLDVAPQTSSETGPADTTDATTSTTGTTGTTGSDSTSTGG